MTPDAPDLADATSPSTPPPHALRLAIIGAGPVGLALALQARRALPQARITVHDALPPEHDVSHDARTLALAQGSVLDLARLDLWDGAIAAQAEPIRAVHVSQQQPALLDLLPLPGRSRLGEPEVLIRAETEGLPQLGAVIAYGHLVAPMRAAWLAACAEEPQRLSARWGTKVAAVVTRGAEVEIDAGVTETHDLAVIAEGGVFADQARKGVHHDYQQSAWVGTVELEGAEPGTAYERFTPQGPLALLPLPAREGRQRAALVWCVPTGDDPVRDLDDRQRLMVLADQLPRRVGRLTAIGPLKCFPLGLNAERSLVQGRTMRIGNAAQTLHPVAGQGLNLGLRDAHVLLDALADVRDPATDVERALARAALRRAPDRWTLIATTDFLARSFTWNAPGLSTLRGAGLALLERLGPVKSQVARRMMFGSR
ncbi:FAD-dependent monooxygenase [Leptothrix discophora]|uniref:FAD-dependent monooxygenase n=1 Tax=Leptothrix discophora TaxID=89 RepID=A0ABT9G4D4_LEPDI|nr:FAD-dependent monooxygenase [Leptothrix discophora]MDP4301324.1 FAD-dependent monooxygenase [Leptothrix discophora]